ncbi:hypothetical protein FOZ62_027841, partial [Perkinsus olseni]
YLFLNGKLLVEYRDLLLDKLALLKGEEASTSGGTCEEDSTETRSSRRAVAETTVEDAAIISNREPDVPTEGSGRVGEAAVEDGAKEGSSEDLSPVDEPKGIPNDGNRKVSEPDEGTSPSPGCAAEASEDRLLRAHLASLKTPEDLPTIRRALASLVPVVRHQGAAFTALGGLQILKALIEEQLAIDLVGRVFCFLCDDDRVTTAIVASIVDLGLLKSIVLRLAAPSDQEHELDRRFNTWVREGIARLLSVDAPRVALQIITIIADMESDQKTLEVPLGLLVDCLREGIITESIVVRSISSSFATNKSRPQACVNLCYTLRRLRESEDALFFPRSGFSSGGIDSNELVGSIVQSLQHARVVPRMLVEVTLLLDAMGEINIQLLEQVQDVCRALPFEGGVQKAGLWSIACMCPKLFRPGAVDLRLATATVDLCVKALTHHSHEQDVVLVAMGCLLEEMRCLGDDEEAWDAVVQCAFKAGIVIVLENITIEHGLGNLRLAIMAGEIIRTIRRRIPCDKSPLPDTSPIPEDRPFGDVPSEETRTLEQGQPLPIGRGILKSTACAVPSPVEEGRARTVSFKTPSPSDTRIYHPTPQSDHPSCPSPPSALNLEGDGVTEDDEVATAGLAGPQREDTSCVIQ